MGEGIKKEKCYRNWTKWDWYAYYDAINEELPAEQCGLELNEEEKKGYQKELEAIRKKREVFPEIKYELSYDMIEALVESGMDEPEENS